MPQSAQSNVLETTIIRRKDSNSKVSKESSEDIIRFSVFSVVWSLGILFHMAQSRIYVSAPHYLALTIGAIVLLTKPSSVGRLLLLLTLQLYETTIQLPHISNHWMFAAFVNITIIQTLLYLSIKSRSLQIDRGELLNTFAPIVRIEVILLYFFVVLHKLNWDFLSPVTSCGAVLYEAQHLGRMLPTSPLLPLASIYITLLVETLIPLLLLFRKTRNLGLLIGLCFHCVIALNSYNGFYDFSSIIFAVYFLFTGYAFSNTLYSIYRKIKKYFSQGTLDYHRINRKTIIISAFFLIGFFLLIISRRFNDYFQLIWGLYSFTFIIIFIISLNKKGFTQSGQTFKIRNIAFLAVPLLLFINGMSPYLGLSTEHAFAMFSNLRTEGGITNHLFIPASIQLFDFQKDMVEVISSSEPDLQKIAHETKVMPFFRFKNHVATAKPKHVVYVRNGVQHSFDLATASPSNELLQKSPLVLRKLLIFRAINKNNPQPCRH